MEDDSKSKQAALIHYGTRMNEWLKTFVANIKWHNTTCFDKHDTFSIHFFDLPADTLHRLKPVCVHSNQSRKTWMLMVWSSVSMKDEQERKTYKDNVHRELWQSHWHWPKDSPEASSLAAVVSRTVTIPLDWHFLSAQLFSFQAVMYPFKHCQLTSSSWCSHFPWRILQQS